jgi:tetratricopeptide (TPR) repeat protein
MKRISLLLFFLSFQILFAQTKAKIDSLEALLKQHPEDTLTCEILNELCAYSSRTDTAKAIKYANRMMELGKKLNYKRGIAAGYTSIGSVYLSAHLYKKAIQYFYEGLNYMIHTKDLRGEGIICSNMSNAFNGLGELDSSLHYLFRGIRIFDQMKFVPGVIYNYRSISTIYNKQKDFKKSQEYNFKMLKAAEGIEDKGNIATSLVYIGGAYISLKEFDKAIDYLTRGIKMQEEIQDHFIGTSYLNLGNAYSEKKDLKKALECHEKAVALTRQAKYIVGLSGSLTALSLTYSRLQRYADALKCLDEALNIAGRVNSRDLRLDCYVHYTEVYNKQKKFEDAFNFLSRYMNLRDTMISDNNVAQTHEMESRFQSEKKDKEILLLAKDKELQRSEIQKQTLLRNSFIAGFVLFLLLSIFIFRGYRQKQKANKKIEHQKFVIEEKQKEIVDSIHYARRIQNSLITSEGYIDKNLERLKKK